MPRPLSQTDQRVFRFTELIVTQSSVLKNRDIAGNILTSLDDRWRYWLHGQRRMSMLIEAHPDTVNTGNTLTQTGGSDTFLARIVLRDIATDAVVADFVHRVVLNKRLAVDIPYDDQALLDYWLAKQFAEELFAMFYYSELRLS